MQCVICGEKKIFNKTRSLCSRCYYKQYQKKKLTNLKPREENKNKKDVMAALKAKYGNAIISDYENLINKSTLNELAIKYGFSRENSKLIFNKICKEYTYKDIMRKKRMRKKAVQDTKNSNVYFKLNESKKSGNKFKSLEVHAKVIQKLQLMDINAKSNVHASRILLPNGDIALIRSRYTSAITKKLSKRKYFNFTVRLHELHEADFLILYAAPKDEYYIFTYDEQWDKREKHFFIPDIEEEHLYSKFKNNWEIFL